MIDTKLIDVLILSLFNLMDFNLSSKFKFILQNLKFLVVFSDQINSLEVKTLFKIFVILVKLVYLLFDFTLVLMLFSRVVVFVLLLVFQHVLVVVGVVDPLFFHHFLGFYLLVFAVVLVFILQMLYLLLENLNLSTMGLFH